MRASRVWRFSVCMVLSGHWRVLCYECSGGTPFCCPEQAASGKHGVDEQRMVLYRDKQRDIFLDTPDELRSLGVPEDVIRDLKDHPDISRGFYFGDGQYVFNDKAADSPYIHAHEESHYLRDMAECRHCDELHEECLTDLLTARRIGKAETICAIRDLCREIEQHYTAPGTIRELKTRMRFVGIFA